LHTPKCTTFEKPSTSLIFADFRICHNEHSTHGNKFAAVTAPDGF
jgi:hypothetical protein